MSFLGDDTLKRLREATAHPDLGDRRYRLLEEIGQGGMGTVYRARDLSLDRDVALKVLREDGLETSARRRETERRLRQEAQVLARLEHPGIVPIHDTGILPDGRVFYTMKLVAGERLDSVLCRGTPLLRKLNIFERLCDAVAFAHSRGIVHRDLKPDNIMVGAFGEVLVMDWGIAKILPREAGTEPSADLPQGPEATAKETIQEPVQETVQGTVPGTVLGTPGYMAPEQARGESRGIDERADIYSLGRILGFALWGRPPWQTETDRRIDDPSAPPKRLLAIARRATEPEPGNRYAAVTDLAAEISRFVAGEAVAAYREGPLDRLQRFYRRHRVAVLLIAAYLLMRGLLFAFSGF